MREGTKLLKVLVALLLSMIPAVSHGAVYFYPELIAMCGADLANRKASLECLKDEIRFNSSRSKEVEWAPHKGKVAISKDRKTVTVSLEFDDEALKIFKVRPHYLVYSLTRIYPMQLGLEVELLSTQKLDVREVGRGESSERMKPYRDTELCDDNAETWKTAAQLLWTDMAQANSSDTYQVFFYLNSPLPKDVDLRVHTQLSIDTHLFGGLYPPYEYFGVETDFHAKFTVHESSGGKEVFCWYDKINEENQCPEPMPAPEVDARVELVKPIGKPARPWNGGGEVSGSELDLAGEVLVKDSSILDTSTRLTIGKQYKVSAKVWARGADAEDWMKSGREGVEADLYSSVGGSPYHLKRFHIKAKELKKGDWASESIQYVIPDVEDVTFWVVVNATGDAVENNYVNNESARKKFQTHQRKPDLVVTWTGIEGGVTSVKKGKKFTPAMKVKNKGDGAVKSAIHSAYYLKGPETKNRWEYLDSDSTSAKELKPGDEVREEIKKGIKINKTGTYQLKACADYENSETEEDEGNNCTLSSHFTVK